MDPIKNIAGVEESNPVIVVDALPVLNVKAKVLEVACYSNHHAVIVESTLPNVMPSSVDVYLDPNQAVLTIQVALQDKEKPASSVEYYERRVVFQKPAASNLMAGDIKADLRHGFLRISIPKYRPSVPIIVQGWKPTS